jgi:four helix bundle protein
MIDINVRTKRFAVGIVRFYVSLPKTEEARIIGKQFLRSGTSVGAHYSEATRARSNAEFVSKIQGGLQELEETRYWLEILIDSGIMPKERVQVLFNEAKELIAILVTIANKTKSKMK